MRDKQAQLEWEARAGRLAAIAAWIAAALIVAAFVDRVVGLPRGATNVKELLPQIKAHKPAFLVAAILTALASLALIPPLLYLFDVTRFRRSELPPLTRYLIFVGPALLAICSIWLEQRQAHAADIFMAQANRSNKHAESVLRDATTAAAGVQLGALLATGFATIMVSLNAMRAGLLSRFMGVLGIILGALLVIPLIASPVIQLFWLGALGFLFWGAWPGEGRGPAWSSGEAIPWPSAQRQAAGAVRGAASAADEQEPEHDEEESAAAAATPNPRASRKRKKRKARR